MICRCGCACVTMSDYIGVRREGTGWRVVVHCHDVPCYEYRREK